MKRVRDVNLPPRSGPTIYTFLHIYIYTCIYIYMRVYIYMRDIYIYIDI